MIGTTSIPAAEQVYRHVKDAILGHQYPASTLLTEGEIAAAVGVSRTPVREALLRLQGEGLLALYPKKGALVLPVSAREAEDVFQARHLIEGFAAGRVWADRTRLAEQLEPILARMHRDRDGDAAALMEADRDFHATIVAAAGNAVIARIYASLRDRQMCMGVEAMRVSPERREAVLTEHADILAALRGAQESTFRALVEQHVQAAAGHLRDLR